MIPRMFFMQKYLQYKILFESSRGAFFSGHFFSPCSDIDHTHLTYDESSSLQAAVQEMNPCFSPEQMSLLREDWESGGNWAYTYSGPLI